MFKVIMSEGDTEWGGGVGVSRTYSWENHCGIKVFKKERCGAAAERNCTLTGCPAYTRKQILSP